MHVYRRLCAGSVLPVMCDVCTPVVCVCGDESMCGALRKGMQWATQRPAGQKNHIQMANTE